MEVLLFCHRYPEITPISYFTLQNMQIYNILNILSLHFIYDVC